MKIFVTGGTGFIGKHLVKKLQSRGHSLLLLSRQPLKGVNFAEGDLADIEKWKAGVEKFKPEACLHLAWEGIPNYTVDNGRKNINYGLDLFTFLTEINCKTILSVGSAWEYRGKQPEMAVGGTMLAKPADTFSAAKWIVNLWGTATVEEKNRESNGPDKGRFIWARILFVYGPGQRETSLILYLINCWKKGETPEIKNPSAKNDFIYIDDVVEIIKNCIFGDKRFYHRFSVGTGKGTSVNKLAKMIYRIAGKKPNIIHEIERKEIRKSIATPTIARRMLGRDFISIKEGLRRIYEA